MKERPRCREDAAFCVIYTYCGAPYTVAMSLKEDLRDKALELGFAAAGFTGVEPLDLYVREVASRPEMYDWVNNDFFSTLRGADPGAKHPWARSIIVLVRNYYRMCFPAELEGLYGRCYQVDERKARGEEHARLKAFLDFLKERGIRAFFDEELPARMAAARAGVATYGRNCFVFARQAMKGSSWLESIPLLLDAALEPDRPSLEEDCPPKCGDRCIKACPTGALYAPMKMNPLKCIAFHTYYGADITPLELRKPMGTWVYGCDACQDACPRNRAWTRQDLPANGDLEARARDLSLRALLHMDQEHYENRVWPHFFYISRSRIDRWQMNAARAMGNSGDPGYIPDLEQALERSPHPNVRAMSAWSLGRLGGPRARAALERRRGTESGLVAEEIERALQT